MPANFHLTLVIGRRLYWEVDNHGLIEIPELSADCQALVSFDAHDHRLACSGPRSSRRGRQGFMQEWGEQVRLVNLSRDLGAQYGRDPRHGPVRPAGCRLHSGLQLIDVLASRQGLDLAHRVVGLRLGATEGPGRSLVLLFAYDGARELLRFQEAANPSSIAYLLDDFCRGLATEATASPVVWFGASDVLASLAAVQPYPDEELLAGVPTRVWWQRSAWALQSLSLTLCALCLYLGADAWRLQHRLEDTDGAARAARQTLEQHLAQRAQALARLSSPPMHTVFEDAEALWEPGTRVRVLARPGKSDYTLALASLAPGGAAGSVPHAPETSPGLQARLEQHHQRALPNGLQVLDPASSGDLHVYYLRFRRETPLSGFAAVLSAEP